MDPDDPFHAGGANEYETDSLSDAGSTVAGQLGLLRAPPSREDWGGTWDEELVVAWHVLLDHCQSRGLPLFAKMRFPDFCDVAYEWSDVRAPP